MTSSAPPAPPTTSSDPSGARGTTSEAYAPRRRQSSASTDTVRTVTELTISFDHRVCDGAEAAAFLTFVARCIERPVSVLAEL